MCNPGDVTRWLRACSAGDPEALNRLMPLFYRDLRSMAAGALRRERRDHTLSVTGLVHEAYLRLVDQRRVQWQDRSHFLAVAAQMMRRILVDHARRRVANKRGGDARRIGLEGLGVRDDHGPDVAAIDDSLRRLGELDSQQAKVVELRFFGGLSIEETAEVLGISPATVKRDWMVAKAWLRRDLFDEAE